MSQHRHVLATNSAKKWLGFVATSVGPVTKNRPASLVPKTFFILYVFLERNLRGVSPASLSSALVSVVSPNRGRARDGLCSTCSNRLKTSCNPVDNKSACAMWTKRRIMRMRRKLCCTTKTKERKHYVLEEKAILTRHNRLKNLRPLSAHTERHRLTSWWPVALMGVKAGSAEKWSKTKQWKWGTAVGRHYEIPQFEWYQPSSKACSSNARLWSRPEKSIEADALRARGTRRREILALRDHLCLLVSASVEMSPSPNSTVGTFIGPENEQRWDWPKSPLTQHVEQNILDS